MTDRFNVYDAGNHKRLLGSIEIPPRYRQGRMMRMMIHQMAPIHYWTTEAAPWEQASCDTIEFEQLHRFSDHGWSVEVAVKTDTPLDLLMLHDTFCLPGEDKATASRRRHFPRSY